MVLDCSRVQLPHLEQISLIGAKMIGTELVWGLAKVLCEPLDKTQITSRRALGIVATLEFLEHHLAKVGHSRYLL